MSALLNAVRACSIALLAGAILHASDVTAGNGKVIDWRTVKSGEELCPGGDAFDTAYLFVTLVGDEAALAAVARVLDIEPAAPTVEPAPRVHAYAPNGSGARRRSFGAGPFTVYVEPNDDDAAQATFTDALARAAHALAATLATENAS